MADIKKGSDLITTMGKTEARLKKVERQLAVPRRGSASTITEETSLVSGFSPTQDRVTIVTTANCLVHFFVKIEAKVGAGDSVTLAVKDFTNGLFLYNFTISNTSYETYFTAPGSRYEAAAPFSYSWDWRAGRTPDDGGGGAVTVPYSTAGTAVLGFEFTIPASDTVTIKNRKLFAWVQPF